MIYDGDWRCGKREGYGTLSRTDPETEEYVRVYVGSWRNDKKEVSIKHCWPSYCPQFPQINCRPFVQRALERVSTVCLLSMRDSGRRIRGVDGDGCSLRTGSCMRESG